MDETFEQLLADDRNVVSSGDPGAVAAPGGDPRAVVDDDGRLVAVIGPGGAETPLVAAAGQSLAAWTAGEDYDTLLDEGRSGVVVTAGDVVLGLVLRSDVADAAATVRTEAVRGAPDSPPLDPRLAGDDGRLHLVVLRCGAPTPTGGRCGYDNAVFDALPPYGLCGNTVIGAHAIQPLDEP